MRNIYVNHRSNGPNRHLQNIPWNIAEYTFFSAAQETFPKIDHIIENKTSHNK